MVSVACVCGERFLSCIRLCPFCFFGAAFGLYIRSCGAGEVLYGWAEDTPAKPELASGVLWGFNVLALFMNETAEFRFVML